MKRPIPINQSRRASLRLPDDMPSAMPCSPAKLLAILALSGVVLAIAYTIAFAVFQILSNQQP